MSKINKQFLVCILLLFSACSSQPNFEIEESSKDSLSALPGTIGVKFNAQAVWSFLIKKGYLLPYPKLPDAPKEASPCNAPVGGPKILFDKKGLYFKSPFLVSPDNTRLVVTYEKTNLEKLEYGTDFALVTLTDRKIIFKREWKNARTIAGIAWSPDSQFFAILESVSKRSYLNIFHLLSYLVGHPVDIASYSIKVYDREGRLIVRTRIASGLIGACEEIVWLRGK